MTKKEAKEAIAKEHGFDSWDEVCDVLPNSEHHKDFLDLENEVIDLYAHQFQKKINDVNVTWCEFLNKGDVPNGTSEADFEKLKFVYGPKNEDVWKALPLDLLWDQVKECGENEDY